MWGRIQWTTEDIQTDWNSGKTFILWILLSSFMKMKITEKEAEASRAAEFWLMTLYNGERCDAKKGCTDLCFDLNAPSSWPIITKKVYIYCWREESREKWNWNLFNQRFKSLCRLIWIDFWEVNVKMDFIFWQQGVIFLALDAAKWKDMFVLFMILISCNFCKNVDKLPICWAG